LSGCGGAQLSPAGPVSAAERQILLDCVVIMLAIVIPVIVATLWIAFRFRASNTRAPYLPTFTHSGRLELIIWSIPALTIFFLGGLAWTSSFLLDPARPLNSSVKPLEVQVVSLDWKWLFIYPEEGIASVNRHVVPVGTPISFELTSSGVMNSFFVPQLGGQIYTMAGMVTRLHLLANDTGTYRGMSANYSGAGFSDMYFSLNAVPAEKFVQWVAETRGAKLVLDEHAYADLVKPTEAVAPFTYGAVTPDLFSTILSGGKRPNDPSSMTHRM